MAAASAECRRGIGVTAGGEYEIPMPPGTSAWVYGLVCEDVWKGTFSDVVPYMPLGPRGWTTFLTVGGNASFTAEAAAAFSAAVGSHPHYLEVLDGPWQGLILDVMEVDLTAFTVWGNCGVNGFHLSPGTSVVLRRHATLGTMFPAATSGFEPWNDVIVAAGWDDDGNGGRELIEHVYFLDDSTWTDATTGLPANEVMVYPGQGFMSIIAANPGDPPRSVRFGTGPVCHVKPTPTLIPLLASYTAIELTGPVWPVERNAAGGLRTVPLGEIGLQPCLEPWMDLAAIFSIDGQCEAATLVYSDGFDLIDAMTFTSVASAEPFTRGAALYISSFQPHYWKVAGAR